MAKGRKKQKITTSSYVYVGDQLVNTDDLNPEQKEELSVWLATTYLNSLFAGRAKFRLAEPGEEGFPICEIGRGRAADT